RNACAACGYPRGRRSAEPPGKPGPRNRNVRSQSAHCERSSRDCTLNLLKTVSKETGMSWEQWLGFFVAAWVISLSPGAGAVASMATGQRVGFRRGYWNIVGLQLGLILQMLIVAAGLGAVLAASDFAFQAIKWFG